MYTVHVLNTHACSNYSISLNKSTGFVHTMHLWTNRKLLLLYLAASVSMHLTSHSSWISLTYSDNISLISHLQRCDDLNFQTIVPSLPMEAATRTRFLHYLNQVLTFKSRVQETSNKVFHHFLPRFTMAPLYGKPHPGWWWEGLGKGWGMMKGYAWNKMDWEGVSVK